MDKLKQRFKDDPYFATYVMLGGTVVLTGLVKATAKLVEASAYAYRATKM